MKIVINYEEASKNRDISALTCFKQNNKYTYDIVVGAMSNEADEIFKIVSEQGYLKKHDSELLDKVAEKLKAKYPPYFNEFGMSVNNTLREDIDDVIADMKREGASE